MSDFLEQVFAAQVQQASPRRRRRKRAQGFAGGRYAVMLTLMAGLTAVPTWVMLRAGAEGLDQPAVSSVQPLIIDLTVPATAPPAEPKSPAVAQREPRSTGQQPPEPVAPPPSSPPPVLEKRSYVDTGTRPVQKKRPKTQAPQPVQTPAEQPVKQPVEQPVQQPTAPAPTTTTAPVVPNLAPPSNFVPKPPRTRIVEPPEVVRPEPPFARSGSPRTAPRPS